MSGASIVDRLRDGVHEDEMHDDNSTSLFDIDDANEVMCEAADIVEALLFAIKKLRTAHLNDCYEDAIELADAAITSAQSAEQ